MSEITAVAYRGTDGVNIVPKDGYIPYLHQWVRDYVDKRSVTDEMSVLVAIVGDDNQVEELRINEECASDRAREEADTGASIEIVSL